MVRTYSRRSMLATAFLPVVAPAYDLPAPSPEPVELRGFITPEGRVYLPTFYPDRAELPDLEGRDHVCRQDGGKAALVLTDVTNLAPEHERPQSGPSVPFSSKAFRLGGYELKIQFRPDGSRSTDPDALGHIPGDCGGVFVIFDATTAERKAAIERYQAGARDDATINVAFGV